MPRDVTAVYALVPRTRRSCTGKEGALWLYGLGLLSSFFQGQILKIFNNQCDVGTECWDEAAGAQHSRPARPASRWGLVSLSKMSGLGCLYFAFLMCWYTGCGLLSHELRGGSCSTV